MTRHATLVLALVAAAAFTVTAAVLMWGPAERSHRIPDGAVSRFEAQSIASGRWIAAQPPESDAFKMSMVLVKDGKRFGKDYPGFALLLAPGERTGLEWLVNPLLGGMLVLGTFLFGRALYDAWTGAVAATLTASSPILLPLSVSYLNTVASACLLMYAAVALLRGRAAGDVRWGALGGFLFGWAMATRPYTAVLVFLPLSFLLAAGPLPAARKLRFALTFGLAAAPWAIGMVAWNALLSGDPFTTPYQIWRPYNELGFGETARGTFTPADAVEATRGLVRSFGASFLAVPLSGLVLVLAPWIAPRRVGRRGFVLALAPLVLVGGHFFYAGIRSAAADIGGSRLYAEALPACAILVACPLVAVARRFRPAAWALAAALVALTLGTAKSSVSAEAELLRNRRKNPLVGATRRLEQFVAKLPPGDRVLFVDVSTYERAAALLVNRPEPSGPTVVAIYRIPTENRALLDAFPGYSAHLVRWNRERDAFDLTPYVPEEDLTGPPRTFPYDRMYPDRGATGRRGRPPRRGNGDSP